MISFERTKELFLALRLNYTTKNYDFVKYRGKVKSQPKEIEPIYKSITNHFINEDQIVPFFIFYISSYYTKNSSVPTYIKNYDLSDYNKWKGKFKRFDYDLNNFLNSYDVKRIIKKKEIFDFYEKKIICIDVLSCFIAHFPRSLQESNDPLILELIEFCKKHEKLLNYANLYDSKNFSDVIKKHIENNINNRYYAECE